jgi:integrase
MPTLTKSYVDKLLSQETDFIVWDNKLSGFGVKVTPKGRKVYLLYYRTQDGRQRKPSIGVHGHITCEQARGTALEWLGQCAKGADPSQSRQTQRQSPSISDLCDRYMDEHSKVHKKKSASLEQFYIRKHVKPMLGTLKTISVTKADIAKFHISLKSTPTQANRILQTLSKMFNLAETWGLRPAHSNPVRGIKKYKEESRERFLTLEEIQSLSNVLDDLEIADKEKKQEKKVIYFINLIRLLMLTGARLSEIQYAKWEWVNLKNATLNLPDSKTGKKIIHLSPASIQILKNTPKIEGNPYIIVGHIEGEALNAVQRPWQRVRKLANLEDVRIHDLRHTFASLCVGRGFSLQMVAKLLGHTDTRMSERYAHLSKTSVQDAAADVGEVIVGSFKNRERAHG